MLLALRVFVCLQLHGLPLVISYTEERVVIIGDRLLISCDIASLAGSSVLWLYTPGEAYQGIQHIYTEGRMVSGWRSRCHVTTNATTSIFVLHSVHPSDAGYYECSEERFEGKDIRLRVKLTVSTAEPYPSTAKLRSKPSTSSDRLTTWEHHPNETNTGRTPENLRLVIGETTLTLADLNALVIIVSIVLVASFVTVMLAALLVVVLRKTVVRKVHADKQVQSTEGESHDYEEIPAIGSAAYTDRRNRSNITERNERGDIDLPLPVSRVSSMEYEEIPQISLPIIFPGPVNDEEAEQEGGPWPIPFVSLPFISSGSLNDQEAGQEGEYWPVVRDGYVEISQRPYISATAYEVLQLKKDRHPTRRNHLHLARFFRR